MIRAPALDGLPWTGATPQGYSCGDGVEVTHACDAGMPGGAPMKGRLNMRGRDGAGMARLLALVLVVLSARALAYALVPPTDLRGTLGGPALPAVVLVALALGLGVACGVLWAASLGVRERARLEPRARAPRLAPRRVARTAAALLAMSALGFAALETVIHYEAGLGWHGLACLNSPVHHNALPILAALSLVAAAVLEAVRHIVAWMRRTFALLRARPAGAAPAPRLRPRPAHLPSRPGRTRAARGPPLAVA